MPLLRTLCGHFLGVLAIALLVGHSPAGQGRSEVTPGRVIVTAPAGALVQLDQQPVVKVGESGEVSFDKIVPGSHRIKVSAAGKRDFERSLSLDPGQAIRVAARLEDIVGSIEILTTPGAEISVDNVRRGTADATGVLRVDGLAPGKRLIAVTKPGFQARSTSAAVRDDLVVSVSIELTSVAVPTDLTPASAPTFTLTRTIDETAAGVAMSPDGAWFATCLNYRLATWDTATGRVRTEVQGPSFGCDKDVSASTRHVAITVSESAILYDAATGAELHRVRFPKQKESDWFTIRGVAFDASGERLALSHYRGGVMVVEVATGRELWVGQGRHPASDAVLAPAFSADGSRLAVSGLNFVVVLDADSGKTLLTLAGQPRDTGNGIATAAWSRDGAWILGGSSVLQLWDVTQSRAGYQWRTFSGRCASFSPDSRHLLFLDRDRENINIVDVATGLVVSKLSSPTGIRTCAITPDWRLLVTSGGRYVQTWQRN